MEWTAAVALHPLHALMAAPSLLFVATLVAMLFRPPDLKFDQLDRVAFLVLVFVVLLRALVLRQPLRPTRLVIWPMAGLLALALADAFSHTYDVENWSVLSAKWIVPLAMFYMVRLVFYDQATLKRLEIFALIVLGYLSVTALLFLSGNKSLILPPFILDEGIGIHADRARGPFLQAVANGVTLQLLGLIALDSYRRRRLRGILALAFAVALPLAVLATKTRAVWLSFAACLLAVPLLSPSRRVRRACLSLALAAAIGLLCVFASTDLSQSMTARLEERSPVQFRMAVYQAGWEMFCVKPLLGWGASAMQPDLARRISGFHQEDFYLHNTFLEIAVQYGVVGLALYVWMAIDLLRLAKRPRGSMAAPEGSLFDAEFRPLWPMLVGVYLLNACFVVMNYQFVNGLFFTLAGILAAQNHVAVKDRQRG